MAKVKAQQSARISVDAFPDNQFTGKVLKIALVPDQQNFFLNPDLKVYATELSVDGKHDFLKTGMSAKVEIIVDELSDVIYVPVQAVANRGGKKVCFLVNGKELQSQEVKTGAFNENYIQITEGLEPGQVISLAPPEVKETETPVPGKEPDKQMDTGTEPPVKS
jgi:multidrug efflux pump subunit AcrA (membrane-fusion protein)